MGKRERRRNKGKEGSGLNYLKWTLNEGAIHRQRCYGVAGCAWGRISHPVAGTWNETVRVQPSPCHCVVSQSLASPLLHQNS